MPDLHGRGVLITRQRDQSSELVAAIEAANGRGIVYPALETSGRPGRDIERDIAGMTSPDITLFVSPKAVAHGIDYCGDGLIGAVGPATASAIRAAGRNVDITPDAGYDSEHLLMCDALSDIDGKTVRIIRAQSGRELLGTTLQHRGANVDYLGVYSRRPPEPDPELTANLLAEWRDGKINAWVIMSVETLHNFLALVGDAGAELAARTPLVSPATRVINEANEQLPGLFATKACGTSADELVETIDAVMIYDDE